MSFSTNIVEDSLIACGRHCCLCHKFCGSKIELHHIEQRKDKKDDSFENCIPLCFDCHAEVKAYNPEHPKGRHFSFSELKRHRDNWYKKVKDTEGVNLNSNYRSLDRNTYQKLISILKSDEVITFLRQNDFGAGSFYDNNYSAIYDFI